MHSTAERGEATRRRRASPGKPESQHGKKEEERRNPTGEGTRGSSESEEREGGEKKMEKDKERGVRMNVVVWAAGGEKRKGEKVA